MSEENVEGKMRDRIRRAWDGVNRKDYDAAIDAMEPIDNEAAWVPPPEMPEQGVYRGRDAMKRRWAYIGENVTSALGELEECIEAGERTFAAVRTTGRGKGSGASYEGWLYQVITTSDDMVTVIRFENYFDRADALEAAGLSE